MILSKLEERWNHSIFWIKQSNLYFCRSDIVQILSQNFTIFIRISSKPHNNEIEQWILHKATREHLVDGIESFHPILWRLFRGAIEQTQRVRECEEPKKTNNLQEANR